MFNTLFFSKTTKFCILAGSKQEKIWRDLSGDLVVQLLIVQGSHIYSCIFLKKIEIENNCRYGSLLGPLEAFSTFNFGVCKVLDVWEEIELYFLKKPIETLKSVQLEPQKFVLLVWTSLCEKYLLKFDLLAEKKDENQIWSVIFNLYLFHMLRTLQYPQFNPIPNRQVYFLSLCCHIVCQRLLIEIKIKLNRINVSNYLIY